MVRLAVFLKLFCSEEPFLRYYFIAAPLIMHTSVHGASCKQNIFGRTGLMEGQYMKLGMKLCPVFRYMICKED